MVVCAKNQATCALEDERAVNDCHVNTEYFFKKYKSRKDFKADKVYYAGIRTGYKNHADNEGLTSNAFDQRWTRVLDRLFPDQEKLANQKAARLAGDRRNRAKKAAEAEQQPAPSEDKEAEPAAALCRLIPDKDERDEWVEEHGGDALGALVARAQMLHDKVGDLTDDVQTGDNNLSAALAHVLPDPDDQSAALDAANAASFDAAAEAAGGGGGGTPGGALGAILWRYQKLQHQITLNTPMLPGGAAAAAADVGYAPTSPAYCPDCGWRRGLRRRDAAADVGYAPTSPAYCPPGGDKEEEQEQEEAVAYKKRKLAM